MKKRDIICMISMGMRKKNTMDLWFFRFSPKMGEQIISVNPTDIGDQIHLKEITDTIRGSRTEKLLEILPSFIKAHAKIKEYFGIHILEEYLISPNLPDATIKAYLHHARLSPYALPR